MICVLLLFLINSTLKRDYYCQEITFAPFSTDYIKMIVMMKKINKRMSSGENHHTKEIKVLEDDINVIIGGLPFSNAGIVRTPFINFLKKIQGDIIMPRSLHDENINT